MVRLPTRLSASQQPEHSLLLPRWFVGRHPRVRHRHVPTDPRTDLAAYSAADPAAYSDRLPARLGLLHC